jgi:creatinine amidohydrolase
MNKRSANERIYQWMTWQEIADEAGAGSPVVIPIGATEQHGPHLPVCTDWVLPAEMVRRACAVRRIVAGPSLNFGYRSRPASGGGQNFPGTVSLRATTFMAVIEDVLVELIRTGFRNVVLYNWHFENANFVYEPAFIVSDRHPGVKIVVVESAIPELAAADLAALWPDGFPGLALEHAALIETALWMHHQPAAIRTERMKDDNPLRHPPYDVLPIDAGMTTASGSLASPLGATADKGELLMRRLVDHLLSILDTEFPSLDAVIPADDWIHA